jgi:hypothetical protein
MTNVYSRGHNKWHEKSALFFYKTDIPWKKSYILQYIKDASQWECSELDDAARRQLHSI